MLRIALIAHDAQKPEMVRFCQTHQEVLARCELTATGTTGKLLREQAGLEVQTVLSGPLGGDQQIGSRIADQTLDSFAIH